MNINFAYAIADGRRFLDNQESLESPNWPRPDETEFVRYMGAIKAKRPDYSVTHPYKVRMCEAKKFLRFTNGLVRSTPNHEKNGNVILRPFNRRFFYDGKAMAMYSISFRPNKNDIAHYNSSIIDNIISSILHHKVSIPLRPSKTFEGSFYRFPHVLPKQYYASSTSNPLSTDSDYFPKTIGKTTPLIFITFNELEEFVCDDYYTKCNTNVSNISLYYHNYNINNIKYTLFLIKPKRKNAVSSLFKQKIPIDTIPHIREYFIHSYCNYLVLKKILFFINNDFIKPIPKNPASQLLQLYFKDAINLLSKQSHHIEPYFTDITEIMNNEISKEFTDYLKSSLMDTINIRPQIFTSLISSFASSKENSTIKPNVSIIDTPISRALEHHFSDLKKEIDDSNIINQLRLIKQQMLEISNNCSDKRQQEIIDLFSELTDVTHKNDLNKDRKSELLESAKRISKASFAYGPSLVNFVKSLLEIVPM